MKPLKILLSLLLAYVLLVAAFESLLGFVQPQSEGTLTITTTSADGTTNPRVLAKIESAGKLYVAVNHWPRAWYKRALANPVVQVTVDGANGSYRATPVTEEEHARVDADKPLGPFFRILTGFPPRHFLRLDPL